MAFSDVLNPRKLQKTINNFPVSDHLVMTKLATGRYPEPGNTVTWPIYRGTASDPTQFGSGNSIYYKEKIVFDSAFNRLLSNLDDAESLTKITDKVAYSLQSLNLRQEYLTEYMLWKALTGKITANFLDVSVDVNYHFRDSHLVENVPFRTTGEIVAAVRAWKKLVRVDGRVEARNAYASAETIRDIVTAFTANPNDEEVLITQANIDNYFATGKLIFLGMNWHSMDLYYEDVDGNLVRFLDENRIVLGEFDNEAIALYHGELPEGVIGDRKDKPRVFVTAYDDPFEIAVGLEKQFLPVIERPDQIVSATIS